MIFILAAFMIVGTTACTSRKASDDSADVEQSSGDESIDAADMGADNSDGLSTDDSGAVADLGGANDDLAPEEQLPDDKGAPPADALAGGDQTLPPGDAMGDVPPPAPDQSATEPAPPPEPGVGADASAPPPMAEEPAPPAEPMAPPVSEPVVPEAKPVATLQKMKQTPWKEGKTLVNAIYFARKGDNPESISQKVFGTPDKVKELCKVNVHNCSRPTKVGDKFYYNSPQRQADDQTIKTFYEDAGIAPQMYTAKAGDNIRKVGKELLGHERSWQEIWATNDVESKGDLDEGTNLRYWPDTEAAPAQTMAKTDEAAAPPGEAMPGEAPPEGVPDQAANTPPPMDNAQAVPPPPPPDALPPPPDQAAAAQVAVEPPPPPPPPPPPAEQASHGEPAAIDAGQDPNQTMALGVGAVLLLAAAALFISIRKKRARRQIDFNTTTQTQIE